MPKSHTNSSCVPGRKATWCTCAFSWRVGCAPSMVLYLLYLPSDAAVAVDGQHRQAVLMVRGVQCVCVVQCQWQARASSMTQAERVQGLLCNANLPLRPGLAYPPLLQTAAAHPARGSGMWGCAVHRSCQAGSIARSHPCTAPGLGCRVRCRCLHKNACSFTTPFCLLYHARVLVTIKSCWLRWVRASCIMIGGDSQKEKSTECLQR